MGFQGGFRILSFVLYSKAGMDLSSSFFSGVADYLQKIGKLAAN